MGLIGARRTIALAVFFVTLAIAIAISQHDSSQVALIRSSIILLLAWIWRRPVVRVPRYALVRGLRARDPGRLSRLPGRAAFGALVAGIGKGQSHYLGSIRPSARSLILGLASVWTPHQS
jgi:hypothetical protein